MANKYFQFKQFTIHQDRCAMKVTTDACLFGAWVGERVGSSELGVGSQSGVGSRESGVRSRESGVSKILDIGSGTGLLALMLAQKTNTLIDAIEIEEDAFEQARENIAASPWNDRIRIFHTDAKKFSSPDKYGVIVSNPPFYENELKSADDKRNIAHHGGLALSDLLNVISKNLKEDGEFYLLLPAKRAKEAILLLSKLQLSTTESMMVKQSSDHDYFRIFIKGHHAPYLQPSQQKNEMSIWTKEKQYTKEFIELLQDYYLYL